MYFIYKFYNEGTLLYVGKTINIYSRFNSHKNSKDWFSEITHIHIGKCNNKIDMDIYELYYINKLKPKYNISSFTEYYPTFNIVDIDFEILTIKNFIREYVPKKIKRFSGFVRKKIEFEYALYSSIDITNKDLSILDISSDKFHWYVSDDIIRFIEIYNYKFLQNVIKYIINNNINLKEEFLMPLTDLNLDDSKNCFITVTYRHTNCINYKDELCTGSQTFTACVISNLNHIPVSCEFMNKDLLHIFKNNFDLKYILNWGK